MRKPRLMAAGVAVLVAAALAVAGCGGSSASTSSTMPTGSASVPQGGPVGSANASSTSGIPQNNGGDHDADNNGGPSDGDGNL
jgi:hypothetical protein